MLLLPCFDDRVVSKSLGLVAGLPRSNQAPTGAILSRNWEKCRRIVRPILARKPMDRCIEVGPGSSPQVRVFQYQSGPRLIVV